MQKEAEKKMLE